VAETLAAHFEQFALELIPLASTWNDASSLMEQLVILSAESVKRGGGPFAAAIARAEGQALRPPYNIIGVARNEVELLNDHTAHAEVQVMRRTESALNTWDLSQGREAQADWDGVLVTTGFPCIGCLGWIKQARGLRKLIWAASAHDIEACAGFDEGHASQDEVERELRERFDFIVEGPICNEQAKAVLKNYRDNAGNVYTGMRR